MKFEEGEECVQLRVGRGVGVEERDPANREGETERSASSEPKGEGKKELGVRWEGEGNEGYRDDEREERHEEHHLLACFSKIARVSVMTPK